MTRRQFASAAAVVCSGLPLGVFAAAGREVSHPLVVAFERQFTGSFLSREQVNLVCTPAEIEAETEVYLRYHNLQGSVVTLTKKDNVVTARIEPTNIDI